MEGTVPDSAGPGGGGRGVSPGDTRRLVIGLGAVELLALGALAAVPDLDRHIPWYLIQSGVAFCAYAVLLWKSGCGRALAGADHAWMLAYAVLFRMVMLAAAPALSDDLHRYLWDGQVLLSGINPFRYPPEAPELLPLAEALGAGINHGHVPTIYPPLAQLVFAALAALAPTLYGVKAAMMLLDLALLAVIMAWLEALGRPRGQVLVYAWSPLCVIEFAGMGHVDILAMLALTASFLALARGRPVRAASAAAAAVLAKLLPLLLVPLVLARIRWRFWLVIPLLVAAAYAPFVVGGVDPTVGLRTFAEHWRGNEAVFPLLEAIAGSASRARLLAAALTGLVVAVALRRRLQPASAALWILGTALLAGPVLHAWYLAWLLPFLCVRPEPGLLLLTGTIQASYLAWSGLYATGEYAVGGLVRAVEYMPVVLVWSAVGVRRLRAWASDRPPM